MAQAIKLQMNRPIRGINIIDESSIKNEIERMSQKRTEIQRQQEQVIEQQKQAVTELDLQKQRLNKICDSLNAEIRSVTSIHQLAIEQHKEAIVNLCMGIVEKILKKKIDNSSYDIEKIIINTISKAPDMSECVVKLNPDDIELCKKIIDSDDNHPFKMLKFQGDESLPLACCRVETQAGILDYFIEEHLKDIEDKLRLAE